MNNKNTESLILETAKKLFIKHGLDGTKMQHIADDAGINKALLHYYFRSKDKLFEAVLSDIVNELVPIIKSFLGDELSFINKLELFVENYINLFRKNPFLPEFIFTELNRNPDRLVHVMISQGVNPEVILSQIKKEIDAGKIKEFDPKHLLTNILALTIFPFVAKPIIMGIMFKNDEAQFNTFIEERKAHISEFIINAISI